MNTPLRISPLADVLSHSIPLASGEGTHGSGAAIAREICGMPVAWQIGEAATEAVRMKALAVGDASALRRLTIKGPGAAGFLQTQGLPVPSEILQVAAIDGGGLLARTGGGEFFLEDGPTGKCVERAEAALGHGGSGVYRVCRQDASLLLAGGQVVELFRHTCAMEFTDALPTDRLIFTRMAGVSCSVAPRNIGGIRAVQLWTDGTFGEYLWETLAEIAVELGGGPVGLGAFYSNVAQA